MKAQRKFGLSLSWARVTTVFLIDVVHLVIASHCPQSWQGDRHIALWVGVGLAVMVTLLSLVTDHGLTVTSRIGHVALGLVRRSGTRWLSVAPRRSITSANSAATRSAYASTTAV